MVLQPLPPVVRPRTLGLGCGVAAPVVAAVAILVATTLDPGFSWLDSALSHTGELPAGRSLSLALLAERPQFLAFDGGLLLAGLLGLPFAAVLYGDAEHGLERAGAVVFGVAVLLLAGVGVFYLPKALHGPVAIGHFLATTLFFVVYGAGAVRAGRRRFGAATAALTVVHVLGWLVWAIWLADDLVPGIALPEAFGAVLFGGWTLLVAARRLRDSVGDDVP